MRATISVMRVLYISIGILGALFMTSPVYAQGALDRSFEFQITPQNPRPNSVVRVEAETFSFDVNRAAVVWRVNGVTVREGKGLREIQVELGSLGEALVIEFVASLNGETISKSTTILPSVVDLIVEPQTYVPVGYKGKALPVHESPLRIVALPTFIAEDGSQYGNGEIIFTWRDGTQVQQSASGLGKNVFMVEGPVRSREKEIRVDISTVDGQFSQSAFVTILPTQPQLLLYLINPLLGLTLNQALIGNVELAEEEVTLSAEPYYFPEKIRDSIPGRYEWELNRTSVVSGNRDDGTLTLRRAGEGRGRAQVSVELNKPGEPLVSAIGGVNITFGIENTSIFGF